MFVHNKLTKTIIFSLWRQCTTLEHQGTMTTIAALPSPHSVRNLSKSSKVVITSTWSILKALLPTAEKFTLFNLLMSFLMALFRRCQYNSVSHTKWQKTHSYQRHQQQCGFLGCTEGKDLFHSWTKSSIMFCIWYSWLQTVNCTVNGEGS